MSAQNLKQLKIKTGMLKRLRKEYESYDKEAKGIQGKIQKMEEDLSITKDEELESAVGKNKQFLLESESVLSNVRQKLIEAFQGLVQFLSEKGDAQGVSEAAEKAVAQNLVMDVQTFLQNLS